MLGSLFNKVTGLLACNFLKNRLQHRCFPVNIVKFLRTPFLQNTSGGYFWVVKVKRLEHTLEHTYHRQISGQISSGFLLISPRDGYALSNLIETQLLRILAQDQFKYSLLRFTAEVTHCITAGEDKHCVSQV